MVRGDSRHRSRRAPFHKGAEDTLDLPAGSGAMVEKTDLGFAMPFKTITGAIFEPGFPDVLMQMWASFLAERAGKLDGRFGCATPDESVLSHEIWAAALESYEGQCVVRLGDPPVI